MNKTIQFSVCEEDREWIEQYAEVKGYGNASNLARFAVFAQMRKNPLTDAERARFESRYGYKDENPVAVAQQQPRGKKEDEE